MLRNLESEESREEETNANEDEDNEDIWKLIEKLFLKNINLHLFRN